jgi:PHP family Zn ribbon phosphoesterase
MKNDIRKELTAPDGTRAGEQIPHSRFVRGFCQECGEPLRTTTKELLSCRCEKCHSTRGIKYTVRELADENLYVHPFDDIGYTHDTPRGKSRKW